MGSRFHRKDELLEAATDFELVIKSAEKYCDESKHLSRVLSLFFAMRSAFAVSMSFSQMDSLTRRVIKGEAAEFDYMEQESLPALDRVKSARRELAASASSNDSSGMTNALAEMGVFNLCPNPDEQLSRMERLAEKIDGRARLVFVVELALFAFEVGDLDASRRYVAEAWGFHPTAWELYNLCILEGLFSLDAGHNREAIRWLEKSLEACQADEHASLNCGIRPPNFLLAQRLFARGERTAVLKHLTECRNVWQLPRMPMMRWVDLIERGQTPDFQEPSFAKGMNQPSCRLSLQWMRARSLDAANGYSPARSNTKSPEEVLAARKRLAEDMERYISGRVTDSIGYLDKGLDAPPTKPSPNPTEPDKSE